MDFALLEGKNPSYTLYLLRGGDLNNVATSWKWVTQLSVLPVMSLLSSIKDKAEIWRTIMSITSNSSKG